MSRAHTRVLCNVHLATAIYKFLSPLAALQIRLLSREVNEVWASDDFWNAVVKQAPQQKGWMTPQCGVPAFIWRVLCCNDRGCFGGNLIDSSWVLSHSDLEDRWKIIGANEQLPSELGSWPSPCCMADSLQSVKRQVVKLSEKGLTAKVLSHLILRFVAEDWVALLSPKARYNLEAALLDEDGAVTQIYENASSNWQPGVWIRVRRRLPIPSKPSHCLRVVHWGANIIVRDTAVYAYLATLEGQNRVDILER